MIRILAIFVFFTAMTAWNVECFAQTLSINDALVTEGNAGTTNAVLTAMLSGAVGDEVKVDYGTANGTATGGAACTEGVKYLITVGTLTFSPGETAKSIVIPVCGNTTPETNKTFFVNFSNPSGATIADGQGEVTIVDDETKVSISIEDSMCSEGDSGTTPCKFLVKLSTGSNQTVKTDYATAQTPSRAATSGVDFLPASGTLTFPPEEIYQYVEVPVVGDLNKDGDGEKEKSSAPCQGDEAFYVNISNPVNATIADGQGLGIILDEECRGAIPTLTEWGMIIFVLTLVIIAFFLQR